MDREQILTPKNLNPKKILFPKMLGLVSLGCPVQVGLIIIIIIIVIFQNHEQTYENNIHKKHNYDIKN